MINRIIDPDSGTILIGSKNNLDIEGHTLRRNIGYVIQDVGLLPHMTVEKNISIVNKITNKPLQKERLDDLMELTGLPSELLSKHPSQLSGGQQQRVGIARALANDPDLILMDEPFSALDNITRSQLQDDFLKLKILKDKTIIIVTHDVQEAFKLGDRIVLLNQGEVQQFDTPMELLLNPANEFVSSFLNKDRLILLLQNQLIGGRSAMDALKDSEISDTEKNSILSQILSSYKR